MEEQKFEPYQKVLARFCKGEPWTAVFYSHKGERGHLCGCYYYGDCIPYEGNEHLVGTTASPKPKWEPKPGELVAVASDKRFWYPKFFLRKESDGSFSVKSCPGHTNSDRYLYCEPLCKHFDIPDEE
ncbi:MAG: hypothetical protein IKY97_07800 [Mailhella sp.]|nr:hypothetical protein [Mailhella sp.]